MPSEAFRGKPSFGYNPIKDPLPFDTEKIPEPAADRIATMATAVVSADTPDAMSETHGRIKRDLMEFGQSREITDILSNLSAVQEDEALKDMDLTVSDPFLTPEQKADVLFNIMEDASTPASVRSAFLRKFAIEGEAQTGTGEQIQRTIASRLDDIRESRAAIAKAKLVNVNFDDNSVTDFLTGVTLPGSFSMQILDVVGEVFPDISGGIRGVVDPGGVVQEVKARLRDANPQDRRDMVLKLIDAIDKNEFYGGDNGFVKWDMLNTLLDDYHDSGWERTLNDIFGAADWFAFLELLRVGKFIKAGKAKPGEVNVRSGKDGVEVSASEETLDEATDLQRDKVLLRKDKETVSGQMDQVSPEDSSNLVEGVLAAGDARAAERIGSSQEELTAEHLFNKLIEEEIPVSPDINDLSARIDSPDYRFKAFTPEELDAMKTTIAERVRDLETTEDYVHFNKSALRETGRGYVGRAIIGSTKERGYTAKKTAEAVAKRYETRLGAAHVNTKILQRDFNTGTFKPVDEAQNAPPGQKNEYLVQIDMEHILSPYDAGYESLVRDNGLVGGWAKFFDKQSYLDQWVSAFTNQAEAQNQRRRRGLTAMLKPLTSLVRNDQAKVMDIIQEGTDKKKWFTQEELMERWGNDPNSRKLVAGYKAFRDFMDESHRYINDEVRNWMAGEGLKHVRVRKGLRPEESEYIGKRVDEVPNNVQEVWDSNLGEPRRVSRSEIDEVLGQEGDNAQYFIQLRRPIEMPGKWIHYILVNNRRNVNLNQLPDQVVQQIPGHVARIYDAAYKISKRTYTHIDGATPVTRYPTRYIYNNLAEAQADYYRLLEEAGVDLNDAKAMEAADWKLEPATELREDAVLPQDHMLEILENSGQLFTSKLGDELKTYTESRVLRPVGEAMFRMLNKASRIGTVDLAIQKMIRNLNNSYSHLFVLNKDGQIPMIGKPERNPDRLDVGLNRQWDKAVAARDYIRMLAGIDESVERRITNKVMDSVAARLATNGHGQQAAEWSARATRARDVKATNIAKMINFSRFMIMNPLRQLALQMHQGSVYLSLEGGMKYWMGSQQGIREYAGTILGVMYRDTDNWNDWAKHFSKVTGQTVDEYTQFVDTVRRSGILDEIDSHQFLSGYVFSGDNLTNSNRYWGNVLGDVKDNAEHLMGWMRRVGFDAGEASQRIAGFLTMKNRWQLRNPDKASQWMEDSNLFEIASDAQVMGLNMSRAGTLEQQRNILGMASQFTSFGQKMTQLLLPERAFGRTVGKAAFKGIINAKERRNLWINHSLMYGAAGWGLAGFLNSQFEDIQADLPQQALEILEQGWYGTMLNMGIRAANGENAILSEDEIATSIDISGNVAPGSAILGGGSYSTVNNIAGRIYDSIILGDRDIAALMLGPTAQTLRDISDWSEFSLYLTGMHPSGIDVSLPENNNEAVRVIDLFGRKFFPLYNSYVRGRAELAQGRLVNSQLAPMAEATDAEIWVRNLFGPQPRRNQRLEELKRDLRSHPMVVDPLIQPNKDYLDDTAAVLYDVVRQSLQMRRDDKITNEELRDVFEGNIIALKAILPPDDFHYAVNVRFNQLMTSRFAERSEEFEIADLFMQIYGRGDGDPYGTMLYKLKNMPPFQYQQEMIQRLEWYIDGTSNNPTGRTGNSQN